jgi:hypothetical protein
MGQTEFNLYSPTRAVRHHDLARLTRLLVDLAEHGEGVLDVEVDVHVRRRRALGLHSLPGVRLGYMDRTGCHQLDVFLTIITW